MRAQMGARHGKNDLKKKLRGELQVHNFYLFSQMVELNFWLVCQIRLKVEVSGISNYLTLHKLDSKSEKKITVNLPSDTLQDVMVGWWLMTSPHFPNYRLSNEHIIELQEWWDYVR